MTTPAMAAWALALALAALPRAAASGGVDFGTLIADAVIPGGMQAVRPVVAELRGTTKAAIGIALGSEGLALVASPAATGATDMACQLFESALQTQVQLQCNVSKVACVWGDTSLCTRQDYCSPSQHCGYIVDNPFVKFDSYACDGSDVSKLKGVITCNAAFTPLGVGSIIGAILLVLFACCCVVRCCCYRRR